MIQLNARMIVRNADSAEWTAANPILMVGEIGIENDTGRSKVGNGVLTWNLLGYQNYGFPRGLVTVDGPQTFENLKDALFASAGLSFYKMTQSEYDAALAAGTLISDGIYIVSP